MLEAAGFAPLLNTNPNQTAKNNNKKQTTKTKTQLAQLAQLAEEAPC